MIKCIIVDDERESGERMVQILDHFEEIEVIANENEPESAVKKILATKPDIVFLDVEMPRMSGFDVVNEIKKNNGNPLFVFVTAYDQYAIKAIKKGAFDYLLKPVDIDELKETIELYKKNSSTEYIKKKQDSYNLTKREKEIISLLVNGKTSKEIANELFISKNTVDTHRRNILEKTGLRSTVELAGFAHRNGLV